MKFSVLTCNIWDIPYAVSRDDYQRVRRLGYHILVDRPDVVLLQEAFKVKDRRRLVERLNSSNSAEPLYNVPGNAYDERRLCGLPFFDATGGLVTLSRYPIEESVFTKFETQGKSWDERFCGKGYTKTLVVTERGQILVVNIHLSNKPEDTQTRVAQLEQTLEDIEEVQTPIIFGGDFNMTRFNCGEEQTEEFNMIEDEGFADSLIGREEDFVTFSQQNPYNRFNENGRYDYIFYRQKNSERMKPKESRLVGCDKKPISDHHGLFTVFTIEARKLPV